MSYQLSAFSLKNLTPDTYNPSPIPYPPSPTLLLCHSRLALVLPIPPLEKLRIVIAVARKIHRTPKHVEHAPIDVLSAEKTQLLVQSLGIGAVEILNTPHAEVAEILRDARTDAGNAL